MPAVEVKEKLYWVGAVDWSIRDFHGYSTEKGTSYNAYLALDDKVTLFDTVKEPFCNDLLHNIWPVIEPRKIDYIVINHVEMDHSGALPQLMEIAKPEKLFCSAKGRESLIQHYHREDWPFQVVSTGDELSLGQRTITFLDTRMVHWPDSMFSYLKEDRLLISSDAFGQHWATSERFDDEVEGAELLRHSAKYYANILLLYAPLIKKLLEQVKTLGLEVDTIAPDHGLIWRRSPGKILEAYSLWSQQKTKRKALIIYDSMWKSTFIMAKAIASGLLKEGVPVQLHDLKVSHISDVVTEALDAGAMLFGSPTLNNHMLPTMAGMLAYLRGLRPRGRVGAAFGSYGWSGEAVKLISEELKQMKFNLVHPGLRIQYVPNHETLRECVELGKDVARTLDQP